MRLTVIGCSGSGPGPDSPASCYLVEADGYRLLLDLGPGAVGPLQRVLAPHEVDAVLLSHLHADHCLDVCGFYVALRYGPTRPRRPVPVLGPRDTERRLALAYGTPADREGFGDVLDVRDLPTAPFDLGPFTVRTSAADHPVPAVSFRLEHDGRSLVYSGDTAYCDELTRLATGADLLLCEASWADSPAAEPHVHMSGAQAGRTASTAGVGRLVITHVPAWGSVEAAMAGARRSFGGVVVAARAGQVHEV